MATQRPAEDEEDEDEAELEELLRMRAAMVAAIEESQARQRELLSDIAKAEEHLNNQGGGVAWVPRAPSAPEAMRDDEEEDEEEEPSA